MFIISPQVILSISVALFSKRCLWRVDLGRARVSIAVFLLPTFAMPLSV
ncbi:hypothetical protein [Alteromonas genovensis]